MTKGNNDPTGDNDYLEQLQWRAKHRRWTPVRFEPKWKYKIVYRYPRTTPAGRVFDFLIVTSVVLASLYALSAILSNPQVELPGKIFLCFTAGLIVIIIFFAIRNGSKDEDNGHKDSDS